MPAPAPLPVVTIPTVEESPTVSLSVAGPALGIRQSTTYLLAATGQLAEGVPVIRVGNKYRVPTAALRRVLGLDNA
jgi:hypothetical protein